jgi:crotonobetainyl-CoA:carnitine CoA-transferase CaiB-like acyl-CoA transferase
LVEVLAGIRVLELTQAWAGPACGELLADFGADVIKVETASRPDVARTIGPFLDDPDVEGSGYFLEWNRNKRSIDLNLRDQDDVATALALAARADVVVENNAPGVLEKLGLSYREISAQNPAIVMLSISGFGATGPDRSAVAYGQQIEAESGLMSVTGYEGGPPLKPGVSYPDPVASVAGVAAVMAALLHRDRTGEGQWIDLSMLELTSSLLGEPFAEYLATDRPPSARGNASPWYAPHGIYPCEGADRWIAIECHNQHDWEAFASFAGHPDWVHDPRFADVARRLEHHVPLDQEVARWTATQERDQLAAALQNAGIAAAGVLTIADLVADPHLAERDYWTCFEHPVVGSFRAHGPLVKLDGTPARLRRRPPLTGEHSNEVREELESG